MEKGFQEQGIAKVKLGNVENKEGFLYDVPELLKTGRNLSLLLSPTGDIIVFSACIEGYDDYNTLPSNFTRYTDLHYKDMSVTDCPIEYSYYLDRFIHKFGSYISRRFSRLIFVDDVVNVPEWGVEQDREKSGFFLLEQEKLKKQGKVPIFINKKDMYISKWVGVIEGSLTDRLLKYFDIFNDEILKKAVIKNFSVVSYDLNEYEFDTYKVLKVIRPVIENDTTVIGWELNDQFIKTGNIDSKLIYGKVWDTGGKCLNKTDSDPYQLFSKYLTTWIDMDHKLDTDISIYFGKL